MTSSEQKKTWNVEDITKQARTRKKAALIIANQAEIPKWLNEEYLPKEVVEKREENIINIWHRSNVSADNGSGGGGGGTQHELQGTFTDGFALYRTLGMVENVNWLKFACNVNGHELKTYLSDMFKIQTENNGDNMPDDYFIYYSGLAKEFNGDWVGFDSANETFHYMTLHNIVKKWITFKQELKNIEAKVDEINKSNNNNNNNNNNTNYFKAQDKWLLIVSDTNYSGVWASKALDKKLCQKYQILVQSSVDPLGEANELVIGEVNPNTGYISQTHCGEFTHKWLTLCNSVHQKMNSVLAMCGSFVILDRSKEWEENTSLPMSNGKEIASGVDHTLICIPTYGNEEEEEEGNDDDDKEEKDTSNEKTNKKEKNKKKDIKEDEEEEEEENTELEKFVEGLTFEEKDDTNRLAVNKTRLSHVQKPSVRRLNLLESIKKSDITLKHAKQKTRVHSTTKSRGFVFEKVLNQIRQLVVGDEGEDDENDNEEVDWS